MYKSKEFLLEEYITKRKTVKEIADLCHVSKGTIENWLRKYNIKRGNIKHTLDEDKINISLPEFCYYAGLCVTDGYVDKKVDRVSLRLRNEGSYLVLSLIKDFLNYSGEVNVYHKVDNDLTITSTKLIDTLGKLGVSRLGKKYNHFPYNILEQLDNDCVRMYLRGILDGDGNIKKNGIFRITISNKSFIEDLCLFINNLLGLDIKVKPDRTYHKLELTKTQSKIFLDYVYLGYSQLRFKRKYNNYKYKDDIV